jgi:hypothetical protein
VFTKFVCDAFDAMTPNHSEIFEAAKPYSLDGWRTRQTALASAAGAGSGAIPIWGLATMPADIAFLMNRMSVCSYGVGAILGVQMRRGNVLEPEDMAVVLGRWAGDDDLADAAVAKASASLVGKVGGKAATSILAKTMAEKASLLVGKKIGGKLGAKLGVKFGSKLGGKVVGSFIPFVGAFIGGGINAYFMDGIGTAAEDWYRIKLSTGTA